MFKCKDPLADMLKDYGFNLVLVPRPDIEPLQLLIKDGKQLEKIGHIKDLFKKSEIAENDSRIPVKTKDIPVAKEMQNKRSAGIKTRFGLQILGNFLQAMSKKKDVIKKNTDKPKQNIETVFEKADKFIFSYKDVFTNEINITKLDKYIHNSILNENAKNFVRQLKAGNIYVITATLKSNSFTTEITDKNNFGVNIGIPQLRLLVDADISIETEKENTNKITYESEDRLVFGFKASRIIYDEKADIYQLKNSTGEILRDGDFPTENLKLEETFADI